MKTMLLYLATAIAEIVRLGEIGRQGQVRGASLELCLSLLVGGGGDKVGLAFTVPFEPIRSFFAYFSEKLTHTDAFHWADFNNEPINDWKSFIKHLLSIPMAHQLIGFYTVADESDGVLKVMRSYQYYAAHAISDKVAKTDWKNPNRLGGYIWHTTGSGKTMTSFKSAQLIANSKDADKVVFLLDRIELGTQTLDAYRNFAGDGNFGYLAAGQ